MVDPVIDLGKNKFVTVDEFKGKVLVNIREYYKDDNDDLKPGRKGIALTLEQWKTLVENFEAVNQALAEP